MMEGKSNMIVLSMNRNVFISESVLCLATFMIINVLEKVVKLGGKYSINTPINFDLII